MKKVLGLGMTLFWLAAALALWSGPQQGRHPITGREYAPVMGYPGAGWLERAEREAEEQTTLAVELMNLKPGMVVADIGAGSGYFARKIAKKVGPTGKVLAVDIQPQMLALARQLAQREGISNLETILNTESDPKLAENSVDLVLMVDVYHEFSQPQAMLRGIRKALRPGGKLVLLEYRQEDPSVPIREEHKMSVKQVRREIEAEGFILERLRRELPRQHMFIFAVNGQ